MAGRRRLAVVSDDPVSVQLFGKVTDDLTLNPGLQEDDPASTFCEEVELGLAFVYGARLSGQCIRFPAPRLMLLPASATPATGLKEFPPGEFMMWTMATDDPIVALDHSVVTAAYLSETTRADPLEINSDFYIHDVRLEGSTLHGSLRSYLRVHKPGQFSVTVLDRDDGFAIKRASQSASAGLGTTAFATETAVADIYFERSTRQLSGRVTVSMDLPVGNWRTDFAVAAELV